MSRLDYRTVLKKFRPFRLLLLLACVFFSLLVYSYALSPDGTFIVQCKSPDSWLYASLYYRSSGATAAESVHLVVRNKLMPFYFLCGFSFVSNANEIRICWKDNNTIAVYNVTPGRHHFYNPIIIPGVTVLALDKNLDYDSSCVCDGETKHNATN